MQIVDVGTGSPVVMVPGIQGRWEWMKPAVDALARRCRVITFSLADERSARAPFDETGGIGSYVDQIREALDARGVTRAAICGVSYGGLVASTFAARHPAQTASLVLVSALPPGWKPNARVRFYLHAPRLLSPLFCLASVRLYPEFAAAAEGFGSGIRAALGHAVNAARHLFSPMRMARRVRLLTRQNLKAELADVSIPTLIVTGEAHLDRVVQVSETLEYAKMWPHARVATLARTGHLGLITRPEAFAAIVAPFVDETVGRSGPRRRIV
jgi:pimeloyl-ACP methyl ester carboxylesterase